MQSKLRKLEQEKELLIHLLNEEQRERDAIASIFHSKKGSISVAIFLLGVMEKTAKQKGLASSSYKELVLLHQNCLDDLYKVYVDICSPIYKLGGLINVFNQYKLKGWLWPKTEIKFSTAIDAAIVASEHRLTAIFKVCIAGIDYLNYFGCGKVNVHFNSTNDREMEVTLAGQEIVEATGQDEVLKYKYLTFEARLLLVSAQEFSFLKETNTFKFKVLLSDDVFTLSVQNHTKELRSKKE